MKITRIVTRETGCMERGRPILIEIHPCVLVLKLKGTRQKLAVNYSAIYWTAAKVEADRIRLEKWRKKS